MGVLWVDSEGEIGYANRHIQMLLGRPPGEVIGMNVAGLTSFWSVEDWKNTIWQQTRASGEYTVESVWQRKAGGSCLLDASLSHMQVAGMEFVAVYLQPTAPESSKTAALGNSLPGYTGHLSIGICLVDAELRVSNGNPAFFAITGLDSSVVLGQSLPSLLMPSGDESHWEQLTTVGLRDWTGEFRNQQGQHYHLIVSAHPEIEGKAGNIRYSVTIEDVTEQVHLKRTLQQHEHSFEHLAENTPGMIYKFVISADGRASFPYASPGSRDIWEIDPALAREDATPILNLVHPDDQARFQDSVMKSAAELSPWECEARLLTPSGKLKWFHAASRPELADNGDIIWQGLLMDISHQKQIEEELTVAKLKAESAARSKADFLANMSHEIRTPMNGVIGMAELLGRTELATRQKYYVDTIRSSAEVLLTIINDILDVSKMEAGKLSLHLAVFDLRRTLDDVATLLAPRAFEKGLEVIVRYDPHAPSQVFGDGVRIRQVLTNLIGNSIKFTHKGHVLTQVEQLSREGESARLRISVTDTGIGISQDAIKRIFDKFEQADTSTSRQFGGSGLGLSISRQLVGLMGGSLEAESELNKGSTFRFELALPVRDQSLGQDVVPVDIKRLRVLSVDDHPINRELLADVFDDWGVSHAEAESGEKALAMLRGAVVEGKPFHVVILDFHMPGMDGLFLATAIRAEPELGNLAMIMLSSSSFTEAQQRILAEAGVMAQLLKPLRLFQLRAALVNLLESDRQGKLYPFYEPQENAIPQVLPQPSTTTAVVDQRAQALLAEDNEVNIEIATEMLKGLGLGVDSAVNGLEAIALVEDRHYDLIFMDCQMPEMDGFEASIRIRAMKLSPEPFIIAMTAYAMDGDRERCLASGMDDYLPKPVTFVNLSAVTEKYLKLAQERKEAMAKPLELQKMADISPSLTIPTDTRQSLSEAQHRRLPLFDLAAGLEVTGGKIDILRRAIEVCWRKMPIWLDDLKQGIQRGEAEQIGRVAHTLKGAASNIGAISIACYAERIEAEILNNSLDNVVNLYECLVVDIERLRQVTSDLNSSETPGNQL